jgi:hypothetical protein
MKKLLLPVLLALTSLAAHAQTACPAAGTVVSIGLGSTVTSGVEITTNTTWTNNNIYYLDGFVYVNSGATLTIQPGTIIKGSLANKGALIIRQGGRLVADGTPTQPIVFTSAQPAGARNPGDWGGLILVGRAPTNLPAVTNVEGGVVATFGGPAANLPADDSGILRYVRIEFPGVAFLPNSEINGLTLCGVGSGTTIDHVQVTGSGDDSFEWFGGTVNAKYLIGLAGVDDDFDTDNGYSGRVQYGISIRDPRRGDIATGGVSNGFESDNDATGTNNTPQTSAVFTNMSIFMPTTPAAAAPFANANGALIRRNSAESIFNTVFAGRPYALEMNSSTTGNTQTNAQSGLLAFQNNVLSGYSPRVSRATGGSITGFNIKSFVGSNANDTTSTVAALGLNADNFAFEGNCSASVQCTPGFALPAASILNTGAAFTNAKLTGTGNGGVNSTFDVVTFRGAFGTTNWASGWTNFNPQITCYNVAAQTLANRDVVTKSLERVAVAPNPTAGAATLSFDLQHNTTTTVRVLDLTGRQVAVIVAGKVLTAGPQAINLPADLRAGVYVAQITTSETSQSVRFVVAK